MLPEGMNLGGLKDKKATKMRKMIEIVAGCVGNRQFEV